MTCDVDLMRETLETLAGEDWYKGVALDDPDIAEDWRFKKLKRCVQELAKQAIPDKSEGEQ